MQHHGSRNAIRRTLWQFTRRDVDLGGLTPKTTVATQVWVYQQRKQFRNRLLRQFGLFQWKQQHPESTFVSKSAKVREAQRNKKKSVSYRKFSVAVTLLVASKEKLMVVGLASVQHYTPHRLVQGFADGVLDFIWPLNVWTFGALKAVTALAVTAVPMAIWKPTSGAA